MIGARSRGWNPSPETRARMRQSHLGKKNDPHTEETKRKMSEASLGRPKSAAHIATMSLRRRGRKTGPRGPNSPEAVESMRAAAATRDYSYMQRGEYKEARRKQTREMWQNEEFRTRQSKKRREVWAARKAGILPMPSRNYIGLRGENHPNSKLTDKQVLEIRMRHASGETQAALAKELGVDQTTIGLIVRRKTRKDI